MIQALKDEVDELKQKVRDMQAHIDQLLWNQQRWGGWNAGGWNAGGWNAGEW